MADKDKINKLYQDIKGIEVPEDLTDADLQEMVTDIGEGLKIILEAIKLIGSKYKQ